MKKMMSILLVLMLMAGILSGCGGSKDTAPEESTKAPAEEPAKTPDEAPAEEEPLKIGFSQFTQEFPFYVTMQDAFEAACAEKGYELISTNASMDVTKQIDGCMDMLAKGVDALAITSWYGDALLDVFEAAEKQNVPVFLISTSTAPDDATFVTKVGTVDKDTTYLAGLWTGDYYAEQGISELDAVVFMAADQVHNDRRDGYIQGMEEKGVTVNILNTYNGNTREDAMSSCDDALITYPEIDIMITTSAQHGLGAFDACVAANRDEMKIVAMDGEVEEFQKIDEKGLYLCTALQFPGDMATDTVNLIEQYFDGATIERYVYTDAGVYCPDGTLGAADIK